VADVQALANAISEIDVSRGSLVRMGEQAQDAVLTDLDYTRIGLELRDAYREALGNDPVTDIPSRATRPS
jgi:hypothetical protein